MKYKIDKNVPLPGENLKALIAQMKKGDSIKVETKKEVSTVSTYIYMNKGRPVRRQLPDGSYRVWYS